MSAVLVKGIIISLSVVAAVGLALQSPEVREWMDEQRRKLAELLRTMSENLDPQTRSQAEAFAYEGRLPTQNVPAAAVSTSRELATDTTRSRAQQTPIDAAERRRLGREYLARRNQELMEMRNRRRSEMTESEPPRSPSAVAASMEASATETLEKAVESGSFGELVADDGTLKLELVHPEPVPPSPSVDNAQPNSTRGFSVGSRFSNPFGDEFALSSFEAEGSQTPRPAVPPKISLSDSMPGTFPPDPPVSEPPVAAGDNFDEQLARALSLSLAESEAAAARERSSTEDEEFERAVLASLSDAPAPPSHNPSGPLVDYSIDEPAVTTNPWRQPQAQPISPDDLYYLTPTPTGRPVDSHTPPLPSLAERLDSIARQETLSRTLSPAPGVGSPSTLTLSPEMHADRLSSGFISEDDEFASLANSSVAGSSDYIEVEDVDIDSLSEDDGIRTPGSWSEVSEASATTARSHSEHGDGVRI